MCRTYSSPRPTAKSTPPVHPRNDLHLHLNLIPNLNLNLHSNLSLNLDLNLNLTPSEFCKRLKWSTDEEKRKAERYEVDPSDQRTLTHSMILANLLPTCGT